MHFRAGRIEDVVWRPLQILRDNRGWLCEAFRDDELPSWFQPAMAYVSETLPGVGRGPHEHVEQTDCFIFSGPGTFKLYLWDNRSSSPTYWCHEAALVGADNPTMVIVPPGVVHGYRNVSDVPALMLNCPNRLYKGPGRKQLVDEIRHERDPGSPFRFDEEGR
jgi:dTDP-4-dehydrorhamnose 3,5-epimerase